MSQGLVSRGLVSPLGSCHADGLLAHDMVERFLLHYFGFGSAHAYTRGTVTTPEASSPDRDVGSTDYNPNAHPHPHPHPRPRPRPRTPRPSVSVLDGRTPSTDAARACARACARAERAHSTPW